MAGIQEYLDKIKTAVYGRDVRQAIHDAIKTCYDDGSAGATDLTARENASTALETANQAMDSVTALQTKTGAMFIVLSSKITVNFPSGTTNRDNLTWNFNVPEGYRLAALAGWNFGNFSAYFARININETNITAAIHGPANTNLGVTILALAVKKDFF